MPAKSVLDKKNHVCVPSVALTSTLATTVRVVLREFYLPVAVDADAARPTGGRQRGGCPGQRGDRHVVAVNAKK